MTKLRLPSNFNQDVDLSKIYILDIETDGLEGTTLWCVGIMEYGTHSVEMYDTISAKRRVGEILGTGGMFAIHNSKFDVGVLTKHGIHIPMGRVLDTMLLSYLKNPTRVGGHSLSALGPKMNYRQALIDAGLLDSKAPKGAEYLIPTNPIMHTYCATDLRVTSQVLDDCLPMVDKDPACWALFMGVEMPYVEVIMEMERTGLHLDIPTAQSLVDKWNTDRDALVKRCIIHAGYTVPGKEKLYKKGYAKRNGVITYNHCALTPFNPGSNDHIATVLQRQGWKPSDCTPTGKIKVDEGILSTLTKAYPIVQDLLDISKLTKVIAMVTSYIEKATPTSGWVMGNFNQALTVTGRLSSSSPNLQNIPGRGEMGESIRSLFTAPTGYDLVRADLSNIEARVLAHYLSYFEGEDRLRDTFIRGDDFHQSNADAWGCTRNESKGLLFSALYGAGPEKVGGGDKVKGQRLLDGLDHNMPAINQLKNRVWAMCARKGGVIHTWFGRRLVYPGITGNRVEQSRAKRQVFNAVLQGTAADILKMISVRVYRDLINQYDAKIMAAVHDELVILVPHHHTTKFVIQLEEYFSHDYLSNCPTTGSVLSGPDWNDAHG